MPRESKTKRLDFDQFPHTRAWLDAFDDPDIEEITLQTGAQLSKTFTAQLMLASVLDNDPSPCVFADADQDSVIRVFKRFWDLLDQIPSLAACLPPPNLRRQDHIETSVAVVYGAWAKSSSKAADYGARVVILNECDKMVPLTTRAEADFRLAIRDRAHGYKRKKIVQISTPSIKGESYIEQQLHLGDNRRWNVPCPHCHGHQELKTGNGKALGGIKGIKNPAGFVDPAWAAEHAWYECEHCGGRIEEFHRAAMCRAGVWVPEGCFFSDGKVCGTPVRAGKHASFGNLHELNSLLPGVTIQSEAAAYAKALVSSKRSDAIRNWMNSHEGKTWDPAPPVTETSAIQVRLAEPRPLGVVPEWARFLTMGIDVSWLGDNDFSFHWLVSAWGVGGRGGLVAFDTTHTRAVFRDWITKAEFHCPSRQGVFRLAKAVIDTGSKANSIYEYCDSLGGLLLPIKGGSHDEGEDFDKKHQGDIMSKGGFRGTQHAWQKRLKEKLRRYDLLSVNTHLSQQWCEDRLKGLISQADASWYSFPEEVFSSQNLGRVDLPKHLIGDYLRDGKWLKRYDAQHYRDAWRYSMVAADSHVADGTLWASPSDTIILPVSRQTTTATDTETRSLFGAPFIATDR